MRGSMGNALLFQGVRAGYRHPGGKSFFLQELEGLSRDTLLGTFRYLSSLRLLGLKQGMGRITEVLAASVEARGEIRSNARVDSLHHSGDSLVVEGRGGELKVSGCVLATPLPDAVELLREFLPRAVLEKGKQWPYTATVQAHCLLRGKFNDRTLMLLPPRRDGCLACGLTMEAAKSPHRVAGDFEPVTMYFRPGLGAGFMEKDDSELVDMCRQELSSWLRIDGGRVEEVAIRRWPRAVAFCGPETPSLRLELCREFDLLSRSAPIWLAGDFITSSSLEGAVTSGLKAGGKCAERLRDLCGKNSE